MILKYWNKSQFMFGENVKLLIANDFVPLNNAINKMLLGIIIFLKYIIPIYQYWKYPNFGCFVSLNDFFPYLKFILRFI